MWCIWNEKMYGMVKMEIYGMQVGSGTRAQIDIYKVWNGYVHDTLIM
jgi:hypothetical protein